MRGRGAEVDGAIGVDTDKTHEFFEFMQSLRHRLGNDYERISKRAGEDPGTAGDEGEESWAEVLRGWLPANYPVVTKGRMLFSNGEASAQLDVLVLSPSYPMELRNKKYYFSGGVLAAFECKLRLRKSDLRKIIQTCAHIKRLNMGSRDTVYDSLFARPFFGILAHSSEWKRDPIFQLHESLLDLTASMTTDVREAIDVGCIANSGCTSVTKDVLVKGAVDGALRTELKDYKLNSAVVLVYSTRNHEMNKDWPAGIRSDALASLIQEISTSLAYDDIALRPWVEHLQSLHAHGGIGKSIIVDGRQALSSQVLTRIKSEGFDSGIWSKWKAYVP